MKTITRLSVNQRGPNVVLHTGQFVADMPWQSALELARAIIAKAKKAESYDVFNQNPEVRILDQTILAQAGFQGLNLGVPKKIHAEIVKEHGSESGMGGIRAKEGYGMPKVVAHTSIKPAGVKSQEKVKGI